MTKLNSYHYLPSGLKGEIDWKVAVRFAFKDSIMCRFVAPTKYYIPRVKNI